MTPMAWTGSGTVPTGPRSAPNATRTEVVGKLIYLRQHDHFGPAKIAMYLKRYHEVQISPLGVWRILKRLGLNRLVAEAGVLVGTIIGTAERFGKNWLHLDVGAFNGMMETLLTQNRLVYPLADSRSSVDRRPYHLTGPTCDSQDTMFFGVPLSKGLLPGDQVYIYTAGAYTTCYASRFNGFGPPTTHCLP